VISHGRFSKIAWKHLIREIDVMGEIVMFDQVNGMEMVVKTIDRGQPLTEMEKLNRISEILGGGG
jgi:hypothetical protein